MVVLAETKTKLIFDLVTKRIINIKYLTIKEIQKYDEFVRRKSLDMTDNTEVYEDMSILKNEKTKYLRISSPKTAESRVNDQGNRSAIFMTEDWSIC